GWRRRRAGSASRTADRARPPSRSIWRPRPPWPCWPPTASRRRAGAPRRASARPAVSGGDGASLGRLLLSVRSAPPRRPRRRRPRAARVAEPLSASPLRFRWPGRTGKKLIVCGLYSLGGGADPTGVKLFPHGRDDRAHGVAWLGAGRMLAGVAAALLLIAVGL